MIVEAKNMKTEELIGALVELDKQGKENRALTNAYKAELQARGISIMLGHTEQHLRASPEAVGVAKTLKLALRLKEFHDKLKAEGRGTYTMGEQYEYIKDILDT